MVLAGSDERGLRLVADGGAADVHPGALPGQPLREVVPAQPAATIITATCDQPIGFALCERWMQRQTVPLSTLQWIVVDDGVEPAKVTCGQEYHRRQRIPGTSGAQSLCLNLLEALPHVRADRVLIVEHDDHYRPEHVERMLDLLDRPGVALAGDDKQRYFHVGVRRWRIYQNCGSALCQTAMRRELLPIFEGVVRRCLELNQYGVDALLWREVGKDRQAIEHIATVVGIKGLPGRKGLGLGHRDDVVRKWKPDPQAEVLRSWIGGDAATYAPHRIRSRRLPIRIGA